MSHTNNEWLDFRFGPEPPSNSSAKVYASDFHLVRVTSGSRYNQNILSSMTDKTADVPGGDGTYYFNTKYKQRQFSVNVAFDSVTDTDLTGIRRWLDGKEIQPLCFDEKPNIEYYAKVTGTPSLKYLPFDDKPHASTNINKRIVRAVGQYKTQLSSADMAAWAALIGQRSVSGYSYCDYYGDDPDYRRALTAISITNNPSEPHGDQYTLYQWQGGSSFGNYWGSDGSLRYVDMDSYNHIVLNNLTPDDFKWLSIMYDWTEPVVTAPTPVYKGEGSITFTCYDPYGYSKTQYSKNLKNGTLTSTISGEVDTPFRLEVSGRSSGDIITLYDNSLGAVASITLLSAVASETNVVWDSKTGMVNDGTGPLNFSGNSMANLSVGSKYTVKVNGNTTSSNAIIYYKHRYY